MDTLTAAQAEARGFRVLAGPYNASEQHMLAAAAKQLGPIEHATVETRYGTELWRTGIGFKDADKNRDTSRLR